MAGWGKIFTVFAAGMLVWTMAACKPSSPAGQDGVTFSDEDESLNEPTLAQSTLVATSVPQEVPEGMDLAECPGKFGLIFLKFSAEIDFNVEEVLLHHSLGDGVLVLEVTEDTPRVILKAQNPITMPVRMRGTMEDCTFSGESSMTATASGFCENGIVHLIIEENWQSGSGVMTCPERDPVQVPMPGPGPMSHRGADGRGEVFYLDNGFSEQNIGYMLEKPFQGQGGSGAHTWTLVMELIQFSVPVSPP